MSTPSLISIHRDGQDFGPYTEDQVKQHIASGNLASSDLAWHEGLESWQPLGSLPELSACFKQSAATPPPMKGLRFPNPGMQATPTAPAANPLRRPKWKGFVIPFIVLTSIVLWIVAWKLYPEYGPWKTLAASIAVTAVVTLLVIRTIQGFVQGLNGRGNSGGSDYSDCSSSSNCSSSCSSCGGGD